MKLSFLAAAEAFPNRVALVDSDREHTFAELAPRVVEVAQQLADRLAGIEAPRVALVGSLDLSTVVRLYALIELAVPVLLLHPRWSAAERRRVLDAGQSDLLLDGEDLPVAESEAGEWLSLSRATVTGPADDRQTLAIVYTSGTSGQPKGVELSRRAFLASAHASAANLSWQDGDRWLLGLPLAHVGGLSVLTRCLIARRTVVLARQAPFTPENFVAELREHRVTLASLVPTMLYRLLRHQPALEPPQHLRGMLIGGAAAPARSLSAARQAGWPALATYGSTETCSQVATQRLSEIDRDPVGCGSPLPGIEVRLGPGDRVEVRGDCLMTAYFPSGEQPLTADGWLPTGDIGRLDVDGNLHVLGRLDEVIISGGENIHPSEVEAALLEHPGIASAVVFGVEDSEWGQAVAAVLVPADEPLTEVELRDYLGSRLARFKQPRRIRWVAKLPLSPLGKVERAAARCLLR